jgi:hypothetical protein
VFTLRAGETETLYGVCCYVSELVQREPGMIAAANMVVSAAAPEAGLRVEGEGAGARASVGDRRGGGRGHTVNGSGGSGGRNSLGGGGSTHPHDAPPALSRYLIAADRCYCFISRVPFFSLHFEVLHSILGMERLQRIRACVEQMMEEVNSDVGGDGCFTGEEGETTEGGAGGAGEDEEVSPLVGRRLSFESGGTGSTAHRMPDTDGEP